MNSAFLFSLGNLSACLQFFSSSFFLGKEHIPNKAKQRLQQANLSLDIYPPAYTEFPEESFLGRVTTQQNSHSVALQLGQGKGKSAGTTSVSQCTHIFCTSKTILVRLKNFLLRYGCIPKNPLKSIINMNVSHNIYSTLHVHRDKSRWCNKNRTFTTCINLNSVFTALCRPCSLF